MIELILTALVGYVGVCLVWFLGMMVVGWFAERLGALGRLLQMERPVSASLISLHAVCPTLPPELNLARVDLPLL